MNIKKDDKRNNRNPTWILLAGWLFWVIQLFSFFGYLNDPRGILIYKFTLRGMTSVIAEAVGFNILNLIAFIAGFTSWKKYKNNNGKYLTYASAGLFIIIVSIVFIAQIFGNLQ